MIGSRQMKWARDPDTKIKRWKDAEINGKRISWPKEKKKTKVLQWQKKRNSEVDLKLNGKNSQHKSKYGQPLIENPVSVKNKWGVKSYPVAAPKP